MCEYLLNEVDILSLAMYDMYYVIAPVWGGWGWKVQFEGQFCYECARRYHLGAHWNCLAETVLVSIGWINFGVKNK